MTEKIKNLLDFLHEPEKKEAAETLLSEIGFKEPGRSLKNIELLLEAGLFSGSEEALITEATASPDPDLALNNLERLATASTDERVRTSVFKEAHLKALCTLAGGSSFLINIALRRPGLLEGLLSKDGLNRSTSLEEKKEVLTKRLKDVREMADLQKHLRCFKAEEYLRIGLRDLLGLAPVTEVMDEISDLAEATLDAACRTGSMMLREAHGPPLYRDEKGGEIEAGFVVLGMGKFGGRELNFSSDIDLIFLYTTEKGETAGVEKGGVHQGSLSFHEYFIRLGKLIFKAMSEVTEEGFVFRVDMNLRPEGQSGDLACSMRSAEIYYESWGQTWERSAMLKARPVAGDIALGEEFLRLITPFMYRKYLDFSAIEEIRVMKNKIDARIARDDQLLTNLKLGTGGIREIEFFIQALQLINAGKTPALRERNSLNALKKLKEEGLITGDDEKKLTDAYLFLRTVEHRLQIFQERQTHTLPNDEDELEKLARRAGYKESPLDSFLKDHRKHTENVKNIYSTLFHEAAEKLEEEKRPEIIELLEGGLEGDEALERLSLYGFKESAAALKNLVLLWNGPPFAHFTEKSRGVLRRVAPLIFKEIVDSPEPDMALNTFERFIASVGARSTLYSLLAENHHVIRLLVGLFGTSSFLSKILLTYPGTLDSLVVPGASAPVKGKEEVRRELNETVRAAEEYEDKLDAMRRFRNVEILRIGINDIYGEIGLQEVSSQLTALADAALEVACLMAVEKMKERYGVPLVESNGTKREAGIVVVGMGKLGGGEMAYGSDLDIIFLYSGNGETSGEQGSNKGLKVITNQEFFAKVGQNIISLLSVPTREGYLFKVDMRLRPSGGSGSLVASLDSFRDYQKKSAQTWERQALTRARVITGDENFGRKVASTIEEAAYRTSATAETAREIVRVRERMELELAKEQAGIYNVKSGRGGLVDIEFLVQFLLLKHGVSHEAIRTPNTLLALERLKEAKILKEEDCTALVAAYHFLRRIENGLRIVHDQSINKLDTNAKDFEILARRLGYGSSELHSEYKARTATVREIFTRYLGSAE